MPISIKLEKHHPDNPKIKVLIREQDKVSAFVYNINVNTPLKNLMVVHCEKRGLQYIGSKFMLANTGVEIKETDTPYKLNMINGDYIELKMSTHIQLKVTSQDHKIVTFKINRQTPLLKLMKSYCNQIGLPLPFIRFRFEGQLIHGNEAATSLNMTNGDFIQAEPVLPFTSLSLIDQKMEY